MPPMRRRPTLHCGRFTRLLPHRASAPWLAALLSMATCPLVACARPSRSDPAPVAATEDPSGGASPVFPADARAPLAFETPGNLAITHPLGCLTPEQLDDTMTPPDLFTGCADCIQHARYTDAQVMFALAGAYGRFDTLRVADATAHQATTVLRNEYFDVQSPEAKAAVLLEIRRTGADAGAAHAQFCAKIARVGAPAY